MDQSLKIQITVTKADGTIIPFNGEFKYLGEEGTPMCYGICRGIGTMVTNELAEAVGAKKLDASAYHRSQR